MRFKLFNAVRLIVATPTSVLVALQFIPDVLQEIGFSFGGERTESALEQILVHVEDLDVGRESEVGLGGEFAVVAVEGVALAVGRLGVVRQRDGRRFVDLGEVLKEFVLGGCLKHPFFVQFGTENRAFRKHF